MSNRGSTEGKGCLGDMYHEPTDGYENVLMTVMLNSLTSQVSTLGTGQNGGTEGKIVIS